MGVKNPNIQRAFKAMKDLGISRERVKPALKRLYKLFDKNWEFIEAENYRALVDAVFEEDKEVEVKRKKPLDHDPSEPPCKKLHGDQEADEVSSTKDSSDILVASEEDMAHTSLSIGNQETSGSHLMNNKPENGSCSYMNKGKKTLPSSRISHSKKNISEKASSSSCFKLVADENGSRPIHLEKTSVLTRLHAEECDHCMKTLSGCTLKIQSALPDMVAGSSIGNVCTKSPQYVDLENTKESASASDSHKTERIFDIVSLPSEEVKLCWVSALGKASSGTPDTDSILKSVEEKFLRGHKIIGPPFSLTKLLKDLCNTFAELGNESLNKTLVRTSSAEVTLQAKGSSEVLWEDMKEQNQLLIDDITKGEEKMHISLVNEHGNGQPPKFFYIPRNIIYQKAIVNVSLARISDEDCCPCSGDCLSAEVPCACASVTNGDFAYTPDGLLKSEFLRACISENKHHVYCQDCPIERAKNAKKPGKCKGHAVRKFIKECWSKCGCTMQCGNRVVQRGITLKLQVFWTTEGKGWGLRTLENLPKGAFVCEYVGEIVTNTELDERNKGSTGSDKHTYPVQLDADWASESILDDDFALCLDATNFGNVARFINHKCCDANLLDFPVEVETVDHHYYHVAFFTTQKVKAYEELTWDYGIDFDDEGHPVKAFRCCCGSAHCRDKGRKGSRSKARAPSLVR